jgi:ribosome recycling factor
MDAMHPTQATKVSCGWIKKGHDKAIETTGSRTRLNLVGTIDLNNLARTQIKRYEKVNRETIQHSLANYALKMVAINVFT